MRKDYDEVISFKDFFNGNYLNDSCADNSNHITWLDVSLLVLFSIWVGGKI